MNKNEQGLVNQITNFFNRIPRFKIVLIKTYSRDADYYKRLSEELCYKFINLQEECKSKQIRIEELSGYTQLRDILKDYSDNMGDVVFAEIDLLLSVLEKSKRMNFFETILNTQFSNNVVIPVSVFYQEIPEVENLYNSGLIIKEEQ